MNWNISFSRLKELFDHRFSVTKKLRRNFGHDDELLFRTYILLGTTIVTTTILAVFSILVSSVGDDYLESATRNVFGPLITAVTLLHGSALLLLVNGKFRVARAIVAGSAILSVYLSITLTGGIADSVATPALIIPPTICFCLYGVRSGLVVAAAMPAFCGLQAFFFHLLGIAPPNFESRVSPAFNRTLVLLTTYVIVVLALVVYGRVNAVLRAQRNAERQRLQSLANEDTLTGIANARHFRQRLDQACAKIDRHGGRLAVLYLDFNDFKQINDEFGHTMGDQVLRHIALRLRLALRREDTVARLGGDEFAILVETISDEQQIPRLIERVRQIVAEPVDVDGLRHTISTSVGRALYPTDVADKRAIIEFADRDMYRAKLENRSKKPSAA